MDFFRRIALLLLVALWLTATQHCALAMAGGWHGVEKQSADSGCCDNDEPCTYDGCEIVEQGSCLTNCSVKVPLPELRVDTLVVFAQLLTPRLNPEPGFEFRELGDRPLGWVPKWQFERRAALSPRAPSSILA